MKSRYGSFILLFLFAAVLCFGATACGETNDQENDRTPENDFQPTMLISEMSDAQRQAICDEVEVVWAEVSSQEDRRAVCNLSADSAALEAEAGDDPIAVCQETFDQCMAQDPPEGDGESECVLVDDDGWPDDVLDLCDATGDQYLDCEEERRDGGLYFANDFSCSEWAADDPAIIDASRDLFSYGSACETFYQACNIE